MVVSSPPPLERPATERPPVAGLEIDRAERRIFRAEHTVEVRVPERDGAARTPVTGRSRPGVRIAAGRTFVQRLRSGIGIAAAALQQYDTPADPGQRARQRQAGRPGPDDADVGVQPGNAE